MQRISKSTNFVAKYVIVWSVEEIWCRALQSGLKSSELILLSLFKHDDFNAVFSFPCSLRVRGQHTKTTGRRGRTVGVSKKK